MTRDLIACELQDLSSFTKALRRQLFDAWPDGPPSHLALMNMVARAAGHRNVQALKAKVQAQTEAAARAPATLAEAAPPNPARLPERQRLAPARGPRHPELGETADRALRQFDTAGRLMRWPTKFAVQRYAIWALWMHFDGKRPYTEREVNAILQHQHLFGDHCTLRRELVTMKLLQRTPDGAVYRKVAARPEPEVAALLSALRARSSVQ